MQKKELRIAAKKLRESISDEERDEKSLLIANKTLELPIWNKIYYHLFLPITKQKEINTDFLIQILGGRDKQMVISKSNFETGQMNHFLLEESTRIEVSPYGIPEPVDGQKILSEEIDVIFVPLLAFDTSGHRIGYGKGFYDRFLSSCRKDAVFIGLSFFGATPTPIPAEPTDVKLHYCVTPDKIYSFE